MHLPSSCWGSFPPEEGVVYMGLSWGKWLAGVAFTTLLALGMVTAQQPTSEEGKRKAKSKVNPQFSDLARQMHLSGKVKIEIVIAPDGHVKSARALGGHPVLVQSCLEAVKDWKYETGPEDSTQVIEFDFKQQ
jgi:TonB family protein